MSLVSTIAKFHNGEELVGDNKKLFRISHVNYYTGGELAYAVSLGLKITMDKSDDNFLHYPRTHCVTGSQVFRKYVKYLYKLKKDGVKPAKTLLNTIWGVLVQNNLVKIIIDENDDVEDGHEICHEGNEIYQIIPIDESRSEVWILKKDPFATDFARMKPFLLASCRLKMAKTIQPFLKHVHYCHTDSIVSDIPLDLGEDNGEMGSFAFEGETDENGYVKNSNGLCPRECFKL